MGIIYYIKLYFLIYGILLIGYYLIPNGLTYLLFYVIKKNKWKHKRIQDRYPKSNAILREIKWSLITIACFSLFTTVLCYFIDLGKTKMYFAISDYGWFYFIASILIFIVAHDTYFYWMHRFMHLNWVFPWAHKIHHLSHTPTPFATLAFGPIESVVEFGIYPLLIFLMPLHPAAVGLFVLYNIVLNTGGHIGYEVVPQSFFHHWLLKYGLTVTHHEMHHSKVNCNYGLYFNFWDRVMHTNHRDYESTYLKVKNKASI